MWIHFADIIFGLARHINRHVADDDGVERRRDDDVVFDECIGIDDAMRESLAEHVDIAHFGPRYNGKIVARRQLECVFDIRHIAKKAIRLERQSNRSLPLQAIEIGAQSVWNRFE